MMNSGKIPIRVAYLTDTNPFDRNSWSGTHYYALKALEKEFNEVVPLGPVDSITAKMINDFLSIINKICFKLFKKTYVNERSDLLSRHYSRFFGKKLKKGKFDLIISFNAAEISRLKTEIPIFYIHDGTFKQMIGYYPYCLNLMNFSIKESDKTEYNAIHNASALIYSSEWAAKSAMDDYKADEKKIHVIPFGANINEAPDITDMDKKQSSDTCHLIFMGKSWKRKGGEIAVATLRELLKMNINAKLTMVGAGEWLKNKDWGHNIEGIAFIDKNNPDGYKHFDKLMREAHFTFLPTRAECFGIAFCESCAYGVPIITTDTGGVTAIVKNGKNGYALLYEATPEDYAKTIARIFRNRNEYQSLSSNARRMYENEFNWDHWAQKVRNIYHETSCMK